MIPIYFENSKFFENKENEKNLVINIGTIDIVHFLTDSYWKDPITTYEVIEVFTDNVIKYRKKGSYYPRRMNRLIAVDLKK